MTLNTIAPTVIETSVLIGDVTNSPSQGSLPTMTTNGGSVVSAALEIQSTAGSLLVPRMTGTQRDALNAVPGMIIYNTDDGSFDFYDGTWNAAGGDVSSVDAGAGYTASHVTVYSDTSGNFIQDSGASIAPVPNAMRNSSISEDTVIEIGNIAHIHFQDTTNYGFLLVNDNLGLGLYQNTLSDESTQVSALLTGSSQVASLSSVNALLELQSTTGALLVSRMTSTERDALESPQDGMIIYNTTLSAFNMRENGSWITIGTVTSVAATTSSTGLTISGSPITSSGTLTFTLNSELQGLAGLSTTGLIKRTGTGTYTTQSITQYVVLVGGPSNAINGIGLTNGQLLIGSNANYPVAATPTNGTNISWTTGAGSLTANISGQIALTNGGTNASLTASNGGIFYSTASAGAILSGTATANQVLLSGSSAAPTWSTATYPGTTTINQLLYSSSANTIAGLTTANNGVLITSGTGVPSISSTLPSAVQGNITSLGTIASGTWNGSLITGTYGGTGVNNGSNTITLAGNLITSGAFPLTLTTTATTNVTLPTSGTLVNTSVTTLSSLSSIGTITSGTWNGSTIGVTYGGTGMTSATAYAVLCGGTTSTGAHQSIASVGMSGQLLTSNGAGALPSFQTYAGTTSLTTVGTISSGTWNGTAITGTYGGTGVNNGAKTITLGGNLTISGANALTLTTTGTTTVTLPTSGTLVAGPGSSTSGNISTFNNTSGTLLADSGINLLASSGSAYLFLDTSKNTVNTGTNITSYGVNCLRNNTTGSYNTGFGNICLQNNTSGYNNTGFGYQCLTSSTSSHDNAGFGFNALYALTTGYSNVGIGSNALTNAVSAQNNVGVGSDSLRNTTSDFNSALGSGSLRSNTSGGSNCAFGQNSLYNNITGSSLCAFGLNSLYNNTASNNSAFGYQAGDSYAANSSCTFLGYNADSSTNSLTNSCAIGANANVGVSNAIVLGSGCSVGIGKNSPSYSLHLGTDNSSTPLLYMASASVPSAPGTANDGIYLVSSGKATFTSGTGKYSGTLVTSTTGSAATGGQATLNGTTGVTVSTTAVTTSSLVVVTHTSGSSAPTVANLGNLVVGSISANTSFVIYSSNALDTGTVNWQIINQ